ncbi:hypothetical protein CgS9114_09286 [Corynebacterium glutamicum S9114]|nr:hypothetical protein CgS9114_09286 [Corynebacterium glutamicum S9114]
MAVGTAVVEVVRPHPLPTSLRPRLTAQPTPSA